MAKQVLDNAATDVEGKRTSVSGIVHISRPGSVVGGNDASARNTGPNKTFLSNGEPANGERLSKEGKQGLGRTRDELKPSGRLNKQSRTAKNIHAPTGKELSYHG